MPSRSTMTIKGDRDLSKKFRDMGDRARNVEGAWPRVGSYLSKEVNQQFVTEGRRFGKPWRPLKPYYRLWKLRNGFSRKILVRSGALKKTFVGRPMDIEEYMGNTATFGSSDINAVRHHYGTKKDGKRVNPPRPILVITKDMSRDIKDILADYILRKKR